MDNTDAVGVVQGLTDGLDNVKGCTRTEGPMVSENVVQVLPGKVLHPDERPPPQHPHIVDADDVGMVEPKQNARFPEEPIHVSSALLAESRCEELQGEVQVQKRVLTTVYDAEPTLSENLSHLQVGTQP